MHGGLRFPPRHLKPVKDTDYGANNSVDARRGATFQR